MSEPPTGREESTLPVSIESALPPSGDAAGGPSPNAKHAEASDPTPPPPLPSAWWPFWRWPGHLQILVGLLIGAGLGIAMGRMAVATATGALPDPTAGPPATDLSEAAIAALRAGWDFRLASLLGTLLLNGLKLIVVPIVASSLILAVAGLGQQTGFARLGAKTLTYFVFTTLIAVVMGLGLVNIIKPGVVDPDRPVLTQTASEGLADKTADLRARSAGRGPGDVTAVILEAVPANIIKAAAEANLLGLIFVALLVGYQVSSLPDGPRRVMIDFATGVSQITLGIADLVLRLAPVGIAGLVAANMSENYARLATDDRTGELLQVILAFFVTVTLGLTLHVVVTLSLTLIAAGLSPRRMLLAMTPALLTGFSTASSSASLPVNLDCARRRAGIDARVCGFVLPLGATVNMNGTALYECVAALFVAQVYGIELSVVQQFVVVVVALLMAVGIPGVPAASLVAIVIILNTVGVPTEGLAIILVVDRPLDMLRTAVNIYSDACGAAVVAASEGYREGLLSDAPPTAP